jgi:hypothetical protein
MSVTLYDSTVLTVEIGFSTTSGANTVPLNGLLTDIVWTDVSAYVRSVTTNRGRNNELDDFSTGTASITLSNADRRFDPEYTAGPYFGAVTPGRPVRVRAQYAGGTTFGVFFGWVDGWDQQYNFPADATVVVTASDAFKILNQLTLQGSWDLETAAFNPFCWWKFGESSPANQAQGFGSRPANLGWVDTTGAGIFAQSAASLVGDSATGSAPLSGAAIVASGWSTPALVLTDYEDITLELIFSTSTTADGSYGIARFDSAEFTFGLGMVVSGGKGTVKFWRGSLAGINFVQIYVSDIVVNDGQPHIIHIPVYGDFMPTTIAPTVDAVQGTYTGLRSWTAGYGAADIRAQIGAPMTQLDGDNFASYFTGTVDEVVIHSVLFDQADCTDRYRQMLGTYGAGDTSGERIDVLLDYALWMSDARSVAGGDSTVSGLSIIDQTVLEAIKEVEKAEQGRLFIDRDGDVALIPRLSIYTNATYATSQATFGDGSGELPYSDITFSYDDRLIKNRSTVSRQGGGTFTSDDTGSQDSYFLRSESITDLTVDNDEFARQVAVYRVATYGQPKLRIESLQVKPRQVPADLFPKVLGYEIGTRITVNRRPQSVGSVMTNELLIEGVAHDIQVDGWTTNWSLSPVPFDAFILDSATQGVLNTDRLGL